MELERILDGLGRLGLERHDDFMARTNSLRKRIYEVDNQTRMNSLLAARCFLPAFFDLLGSWLGIGRGAQPDWLRFMLQQSSRHPLPIFELLSLRVKLIHSRWNEGKSSRLLSFPTHDHGWIDPRTFVARLKQMPLSEAELCRPDLLSALLRLAPDFRADAIRESAGLADPLDRIVRYALGDDVRPTAADRNWKAEWLAAGRVRSPQGRLDELEVLDLPAAANAIVAVRFRIRLDRLPTDVEQRKYQYVVESDVYIEVEPHGQTASSPAEYPLLVMTHRLTPRDDSPVMYGGLPAWAEAWLASLWPSSSEPFLVGAIQNLLLRLDIPASSWEGLAAASSLSPLLKPERGWSPAAIYALWLAIFSRDADARAVAIDAFVEGLLDGRVHPEPLAEILVEIAGYNWAKLNRLAEGLRQVARISLWGALVVSRILDRLMASWNELPRDAHHILEVQLELLMQLNLRLSDAAMTPLKALSGGGSKTTKLAGQLLELKGAGDSSALRATLLEGLDRRIARVEYMQNARD